MTKHEDVSDEELLRLARLAWPTMADTLELDGDTIYSVKRPARGVSGAIVSVPLITVGNREAMHAALHVLAGEKGEVERLRANQLTRELAATDVLRRHLTFYRKRQSELETLGRAGDLNARGQAYECELHGDFVQELLDECGDAVDALRKAGA